jgi:hypothetical protein
MPVDDQKAMTAGKANLSSGIQGSGIHFEVGNRENSAKKRNGYGNRPLS